MERLTCHWKALSSHRSPGSQADRLQGLHQATRRPRTCLEKQSCQGTMLNWSQTDLGQSSLRHLPVSIPGTHLASLGFRFSICEVDRLISTPEGGGQVKRNSAWKSPLQIEGGGFLCRGGPRPPKAHQRRSSLGSPPGGAFGTSRCGAVLGAGVQR